MLPCRDMKWRKNQERNRKIVEMYQFETKDTRKIAEHFGMKVPMIRVVLNTNGIQTKRLGRMFHSACVDHRDTVLRMEKEGCSLSEIGHAVGTTGARVRGFLRREGIDREFPKAFSGERCAAWRGGFRINKNGYREILSQDHPNKMKAGYVLEHRLVMEKMIGRYLLPKEVVHHKDGNKLNNSPENLQLFSENSEHLAVDLKGRCPKWSPEGYKKLCSPKHRRPLAELLQDEKYLKKKARDALRLKRTGSHQKESPHTGIPDL